MMSCIAILYIALFHADASPRGTLALAAVIMTQAPPPQPASGDPDALYANRTDIASAKKAADIWEARLRDNPKDFDSAAKLTRTYYWLGRHASEDERRTFLERGIAAGRTAVALQPNRPEGHFWIAANMGGLAESFGMRQGLKYRGEIRDELMTTLRLDAAFQQGSADRALGRWYYKVPGLFGGSNAKAEEHLRRSLTYSPGNTASLYFLAEVLIATKRGPEAQAVLQKLIASPGEPGWGPEDSEYKIKGQRLLDKLKSGG
jgi:Tetratricopeptide repeat